MSKRKSKNVGPVNWYEKVPTDMKKTYKNPNFDFHRIKVPFRMLVCAPGGFGKTNFALNLIHDMPGTFQHITICLKSKEEELYKLLEKQISEDNLTFYENSVPNMDTLGAYHSSLVIFDDLVNEKKLQQSILEYFIRGRKKGISMMYLTQIFYKVPKDIRTQCNYIVLKRTNQKKDLKLMLDEYNFGIDKDILMNIYKACTNDDKRLNWFMIDLDNADDSYRFRCNYKPITINEERDKRPYIPTIDELKEDDEY